MPSNFIISFKHPLDFSRLFFIVKRHKEKAEWELENHRSLDTQKI